MFLLSRLKVALLMALAVLLSVSAMYLVGTAMAALPARVTAPLVVNNTSDTDDGTCDAAHCSLREAINAANGTAGAASITFNLSTPAIITLSGQLPNIASDVTLTGPGASQLTLSGNRAVRVLQVDSGAALTLDSLAVAYGNANGGGIYNSGMFTLTNSIVFSNTAVNGGGIYNYFGTVVISGSTIANNSGSAGGGGILNWGGNVTVVNSTVIQNVGSGLVNVPSNGVLTIMNSAIANNRGTNGGGIANFNSTVTLMGVTVSGNTSTSASGIGGGGILNNSGVMTLTNSTVSGNSAVSSGGGIYIFKNPAQSARMDLNNVTIANNTTDIHGNGSGDGGGIRNSNAIVYLKNTLISGNVDNTGEAPDCSGTLTSQDCNLIQNTSGCTLTGTVAHNRIGENPLLGPLQDNGGSTYTHALLSNSPAIDAGNPAVPGSTGDACEGFDQRGVARPQGIACDIGAYEYAVPVHQIYLPIVLRN